MGRFDKDLGTVCSRIPSLCFKGQRLLAEPQQRDSMKILSRHYIIKSANLRNTFTPLIILLKVFKVLKLQIPNTYLFQYETSMLRPHVWFLPACVLCAANLLLKEEVKVGCVS